MSLNKIVHFLIISFLINVSIQAQENTSIDTTRVRKTEKIKKTTGEIFADIPGEILKLPVYTVKFISSTIISNPPVENIAEWIDFHAEARPWIPVLGFNTRAGLKFGFGLRKLKNIASTDHLKGKFSYSIHKYQSYKLEFRNENLFSSRTGLDLYLRYKKRPRESFYGIGSQSEHAHEANYTYENTELKAELPTRIIDNIFISFIGSYQISNLTDGTDSDTPRNLDTIFTDTRLSLEPGHLDNSRYFTIGTSVEWDGVDNYGQPSKGTHAIFQYKLYKGINRSENLDFNKLTIDVRQYFDIWRKRIIALRAYVQKFGANDNNLRAIPIYYLSDLGGRETLRGYKQNRFLDNDAVLLSVEYRYPIYDILDAFFFLDGGRVYNSMSDEKFFTDWKNSYGFGIRAWNNRTVITTVQVASSNESTQFLFEMGTVW